ncbi:MAG: hypothetical protein ACK5YO_25440, partial [Planctomyces sp.]
TTGQLTGGHAIVLIGCSISANQVCILDPWYSRDGGGAGPNKWRQHHSLEAFNDFFKWQEWMPRISLMYKQQTSAMEAISHIKLHQELMWW